MKKLANLKPLVILGPSGSGKSMLAKSLSNRYPEYFEPSISCTTRAPRMEEIPGIHYYFLDKDKFLSMIHQKEFLEYQMVYNNMYGTRLKEIKRIQAMGKICMLVIDIMGAMSLNSQNIPANYIAIFPPSLKELRERLRLRRSETSETLQLRIASAEWEMAQIDKLSFIRQRIINQDKMEFFQKSFKLIGAMYDINLECGNPMSSIQGKHSHLLFKMEYISNS